ncbi:MAG TPA: hypothetical protein VHL09_13500 [Dehalococcoidia bacterium]|nr:hypothetical protein [Dehalococcoidia bacterium]
MVQSAIPPLAPEILDKLRALPVATITGLLNERGLSNIFMRGVMPLDPAMKVAAQAFTLRYLPKREDLTKNQTPEQRRMRPQRHAIDYGIAAGQVLVIDARGEMGSGVIGDLLATRLKYRGGAGVVTDGAFRDASALKEMGLMLFGSGSSGSATPHAHFDADYGLPIQCGGVTVVPGDVIVGDADGVVVIPSAMAEEIAEAGHEREDFEGYIRDLIASGVPLAEANPPSDEYRQAYQQQRAKRLEAGRSS